MLSGFYRASQGLICQVTSRVYFSGDKKLHGLSASDVQFMRLNKCTLLGNSPPNSTLFLCMTKRWLCFAVEPILGNYAVVHELYSNAKETSFFNDLAVFFQGKQVCFYPTRINNYYSMLDANNEVHTTSTVIPLRNETNVSLDRVLLICDIIEGIPINVQCLGDNMRSPKGPIHSLKKKGPWQVNKKRMSDVRNLEFRKFIEGRFIGFKLYLSSRRFAMEGTTNSSLLIGQMQVQNTQIHLVIQELLRVL
ncbi:hypothetical protein R3W88_008066 [Solanum pinnatisectum]|uniref:Uncharacterized protein n=1 Tax=Solanum pinnatisectum TaxID=50273 RepID=A0AAV9MAB1_9SOLN|nr:hypothetical protein R3W88_008066 [Solanum pinnatisectum]